MEDLENDYTHIPNKKTLETINNLSPENLYERYITTNTTPEIKPIELWRNNFFDEAYLEDPSRPNYYKRPFTASLSGRPLSYIGGELKDKILPFLPKELKINASNIIEDLEQILLENRKLSLKSINSVNDFIKELSVFFTNSLKTAITENIDLETSPTDDE